MRKGAEMKSEKKEKSCFDWVVKKVDKFVIGGDTIHMFHTWSTGPCFGSSILVG